MTTGSPLLRPGFCYGSNTDPLRLWKGEGQEAEEAGRQLLLSLQMWGDKDAVWDDGFEREEEEDPGGRELISRTWEWAWSEPDLEKALKTTRGAWEWGRGMGLFQGFPGWGRGRGSGGIEKTHQLRGRSGDPKLRGLAS